MIIFMPGKWSYYAGNIFVFKRIYMDIWDRKLKMKRPKPIPFCRMYLR